MIGLKEELTRLICNLLQAMESGSLISGILFLKELKGKVLYTTYMEEALEHRRRRHWDKDLQ